MPILAGLKVELLLGSVPCPDWQWMKMQQGESYLRQIGQSLPGAYVEITESPTKPRISLFPPSPHLSFLSLSPPH